MSLHSSRTVTHTHMCLLHEVPKTNEQEPKSWDQQWHLSQCHYRICPLASAWTPSSGRLATGMNWKWRWSVRSKNSLCFELRAQGCRVGRLLGQGCRYKSSCNCLMRDYLLVWIEHMHGEQCSAELLPQPKAHKGKEWSSYYKKNQIWVFSIRCSKTSVQDKELKSFYHPTPTHNNCGLTSMEIL